MLALSRLTYFAMTLSLAMPLLARADERVSEAPERSTPSELKVEILYCHDGDTCRVKLDDAFWLNVRLAGIDTPEVKGRRSSQTGQPMGDAARDYLNAQIQGKVVRLRQTDLDAYNRLVVEIYDEHKNINLAMIEQGFAEAYRGKAKRLNRDPYYAAEKQAQEKKVGIWAMKDYKSPASYRSETKGR